MRLREAPSGPIIRGTPANNLLVWDEATKQWFPGAPPAAPLQLVYYDEQNVDLSLAVILPGTLDVLLAAYADTSDVDRLVSISYEIECASFPPSGQSLHGMTTGASVPSGIGARGTTVVSSPVANPSPFYLEENGVFRIAAPATWSLRFSLFNPGPPFTNPAILSRALVRIFAWRFA